MNDDSIRFFKHQYRINARSISREQWLRMLNENVKLWGSSMVPWCGYTDDLILFMQDIHLMQRATTIFDEVFTNYGLCINVSKTESMSLNSSKFKYIDSFISQANLTREILKLIAVYRWHTQNLLPWRTWFETLRYTLISESRLWRVLSAADSLTHVRIRM